MQEQVIIILKGRTLCTTLMEGNYSAIWCVALISEAACAGLATVNVRQMLRPALRPPGVHSNYPNA